MSPAAPKTVLVVDDEFAITEILSGVLEDVGYRVATAGNGREGLERLPEVRPDIVICDVMMPVLDGRELCRALQANPATRGIPVVLMSAVSEGSVRATCTYAAFISKPFDLDTVLDVIARLIGTAIPPTEAPGT